MGAITYEVCVSWSTFADVAVSFWSQDMKQYYKDYKEMKLKEKEQAEAQAEQETQQSKTFLWSNFISLNKLRFISRKMLIWTNWWETNPHPANCDDGKWVMLKIRMLLGYLSSGNK